MVKNKAEGVEEAISKQRDWKDKLRSDSSNL
jgi:hypothetical protein